MENYHNHPEKGKISQHKQQHYIPSPFRGRKEQVDALQTGGKSLRLAQSRRFNSWGAGRKQIGVWKNQGLLQDHQHIEEVYQMQKDHSEEGPGEASRFDVESSAQRR